MTDLEFSKRLRELFERCPSCGENDIALLKLGRHFWQGFVKIIVGRDHQENLRLKKLAKKGDILIELKQIPGPMTLVRSYSKSKVSEKIIEKAKAKTKYYSVKARNKKNVRFSIKEVVFG